MPRHVAFSHKQKKEQLKAKRAIKRGDAEAPPPTVKKHSPKGRVAGSARWPRDAVAAAAPSRLQSSFYKLPKPFLDETRRLAAEILLHRPIPPDVAIWADQPPNVSASVHLTCPQRPKWRYDMSKKEVENNEAGQFAKWLDQTDAVVNGWCDAAIPDTTPADPEGPEEPPQEMPRAPTSFERNLEVWRQLWRVAEISQIILVLLDSRCPLLHYPPSLEAYLASPHLARKRTILVLTKVDISGAARAEAWTQYLQQRYPHLRIVQVESYAEKPAGSGSSSRKTYEPHLPSVFRQTLVNALRDAHAELLQPPAQIRDAPDKVAAWKPPVKRVVDWDEVLNAHGDKVGAVVGGAAAHRRTDSATDIHGGEHPQRDPGASENEFEEPEYLTVGVIGQPNVGKSSLLNALFGVQRVSASKTPGKTKHFQTLFWTPDVRLVDCPGLVMPNLVPMETQVLSGILPISHVSAVSLCIHHAAQLLPLEHILKLEHPEHTSAAPVEDKRTWRGPRPAHPDAPPKTPAWHAMDILVAFANKQGYMTARTGRPDINRAGNAILRSLVEGRIRWAFWPPGTPIETVRAHYGEPDGPEGTGIWVAHGADIDFSDMGHDERHQKDMSSESDDDTASDESDDDEYDEEPHTSSRFAALNISEGEEDTSEKED